MHKQSQPGRLDINCLHCHGNQEIDTAKSRSSISTSSPAMQVININQNSNPSNLIYQSPVPSYHAREQYSTITTNSVLTSRKHSTTKHETNKTSSLFDKRSLPKCSINNNIKNKLSHNNERRRRRRKTDQYYKQATAISEHGVASSLISSAFYMPSKLFNRMKSQPAHVHKLLVFSAVVLCFVSVTLKSDFVLATTQNQEAFNGVATPATTSIGRECQAKQSCGDCFSASADCAWCKQESYSNTSKPRCDSKYNLLNAGCHPNDVVRPEAEYEGILDRELSNRNHSGDDVTQLRPQRIKLRLPPHVPKTIRLHYKQVEDYPVDLYYLMDLSKSMEDDKAKLAELGNLLASNMQRITPNFRLGFGSFVDKVAMPFVSTVPEKLKAPCPGCAAPYGFMNHMPLNTDTSGFTREVNASQISGNLDAPEGGLDAILQAIVCRDEIGWRSTSARKMLVFTTDANCHYAGDGKLAGIVTPNDGKCHLSENGLYTESLEQDYPSISQIHQIAKEHKVNIIFATTSHLHPIYKKLTPLIEGSSAGKLDNDSSNIVELVQEQYEKITSKIELKDNATSHVQLTYRSSCSGDKSRETSICEGIKLGSTVSFDIDIEVKSCPKKRSDYNQTIQIYPVGLNEALLIDLEIICECDCEKPWNIIEHSINCNNHGTEVCGICMCDPLRYGRQCECDARETDPTKDILGCYNDKDTRVCSGRGSCRCGKCDCHQSRTDPSINIYGKYCECDNYSCFHHEGLICSGPDHGTCKCGTCDCIKPWTGPSCNCLNTTDTCIDPKTKKICAGHGDCICGACQCHVSEDRQYAGKYCDECPTCPTMCEQYKDCVRCTMYQTGPITPEDCVFCRNSTFSIENVTKLEVEPGIETHCVFVDEDNDCRYQFKYRIDPTETGEKVYIHALWPEYCPIPIPLFLILLLLALLILLLGLLGLLLWKCLTMWKDSREIAKFEKERLTAKWDTGENPIFKQATSTFRNPTYQKKH